MSDERLKFLTCSPLPPLSGRADTDNRSAGDVHHDRRGCGANTSAHSGQSDDKTSQTPLCRKYSLWSDRGDASSSSLTSCLRGYVRAAALTAVPSVFFLLRSPWPSSSTLRCGSQAFLKPRATLCSLCRLTRIKTLLSSRFVLLLLPPLRTYLNLQLA